MSLLTEPSTRLGWLSKIAVVDDGLLLRVYQSKAACLPDHSLVQATSFSGWNKECISIHILGRALLSGAKSHE